MNINADKLETRANKWLKIANRARIQQGVNYGRFEMSHDPKYTKQTLRFREIHEYAMQRYNKALHKWKVRLSQHGYRWDREIEFKNITGLDWKTVEQFIGWAAEVDLHAQIDNGEELAAKWKWCQVDGAEEYLKFVVEMTPPPHKASIKLKFIEAYESELLEQINLHWDSVRDQAELDRLSRGPITF